MKLHRQEVKAIAGSHFPQASQNRLDFAAKARIGVVDGRARRWVRWEIKGSPRGCGALGGGSANDGAPRTTEPIS